ncbi:MAG TPA: metal-dependent transcriptional regulator, partial [Acidimicrobiales bacterium]|nr:metal-dependent transcriptional regulator [Acidimicrobiales bacterium]
MALHPAFEEYAEVIWELGEDDLDRIQARVADRLGCSRPAVSEGIRRMERAGLVRRDGRTLRLTADGEQLAVRTVRRHRLAERMLTDVLGVGWAEAHAEAGVWEHVLSDEVTDRLEALLDHPTTCPHGNPIPGASPVPIEDTVPLSEVPVGRRCWIRRVTEQVEHTEGALELL